MSSEHGNVLERGSRLKKLLAASATALVLGVAAASPSWAAVNGPHTVTAFPDRDFIGAEGYQNGIDMQIKVLRNGIVIGDTGPARTVPVAAGSGLEVNHGAEGTPGPGDCWDGSTPDIQGGDVVQVITPSGTETMTVADIGFSAGQPTTNASGDVVTEGFARNVDAAALTAEARHDDPEADPTSYRPEFSTFGILPGTTTWQATWAAADHTPVEMDRIEQAGFSLTHTAGAENEVTISENGEVNGPAAGCEEVAPAAATGIGGLSRDLVNIANVTEPIVVSGVSTPDITRVNLSIGGQTISATPANGTWEASIPATVLANLPQDNSNLVASFVSSNNTAPANQTRVIKKDTQAPGAATSNVAPGPYNSDQAISLGSPEGNAKIHYTVDGSEPTAASPSYAGEQILVTSSQTIKAVVVDAAGNPGPSTSFAYVIDKVAPGLTPSLAEDSYDTAQSLALDSEPGASIFYTTDGTTPGRSSTPYTGPIQIPSTQTIKAIAYDAAGNASGVETRTITIRKATRTTLGLATTDLKLGRSRVIQGAVGPNQAGGTVKVTIDRPGTLANATRTLSVDDFSRYTMTYRPNAVGVYRVTVSFQKDADALGSTSVMKSFRVIR